MRAAPNRSRRGFALVEGVVASAIVAVAITALFGLWAGMFKRDASARLVGEAGQLARAEVERAKVFGMDNLPTGTYDSASGTAAWTGAYSPSSNGWVSGATATYDASGNVLSSPASAGAALTMQTTMVDTNVLAKPGGYSFQLSSRRSFVVAVNQVSDGATLLKIGTVIAPGGL